MATSDSSIMASDLEPGDIGRVIGLTIPHPAFKIYKDRNETLTITGLLAGYTWNSFEKGDMQLNVGGNNYTLNKALQDRTTIRFYDV